MKHTILTLLTIVVLASCSTKIDNLQPTGTDIAIFPDYKNVTAPCNIAPLNFTVTDSAKADAVIISANGDSIICKMNGFNSDISVKQWRKFIADKASATLTFTVCHRENGKWLSYKPFSVTLSSDSIDNTLVYRLIAPGYEIWNRMGIYQRNIETYDEKPIFENRYERGNCVNCHSFCLNNSEKMMMHVRSGFAGTYTFIDGKTGMVDGDFSQFVAKPTYPYWHPNGKFIAYSLNKIFQDFHTADSNIIEVYDDISDVIVYNLESKDIISSPLTCSDKAFETFPCFAPNGSELYFCSASAFDSVKWNYKNAKYNICKVSFDAEKQIFGNTIDTIVDAKSKGKSASFPRISPNGRFLLYTLSDYGNFSIWHNEANLHMIDLSTGDSIDIENINSSRTESYHSWSSNSHWIVFSSRRIDGLYTRLYFAHVDDNGNTSKPVLLPQRNPLEYYLNQFNSYNIPELVKSEVEMSAYETDKKIRSMAK